MSTAGSSRARNVRSDVLIVGDAAMLILSDRQHTAAVTLPHHNGRTEGVNNIKTKMIKRQMFGRAGFELLRRRILLG
jgi:transposase